MIHESAFRELLTDLYAGVKDPDRLRNFMAGLARASGSHTVGFTRRNHLLRTGSTLQAVGDGADVDIILKYEAEFVGTAENIWYERSSPHIHTGSIINSEDWATKQEIKRTRYHADFLRKIDTMHSVAMCGLLRGPHVALLSFCRSERSGAFEADELGLFRELGPHWVNAYSLLFQLEKLKEFANVPGPAVFELDANLKWTGGNAAAEKMISAGWWQGRRGSRIEPVSAASRTGWITAQRELCARPCNSAGHLIPIYDKLGTLVAFASLRGHGSNAVGQGLPVYVLFVNPVHTECEGDLARTLSLVFSLTPAEAALAVAMRECEDISQAAEMIGIGENSARTRLQSIYDKTSLHRQSGLLRMLDALAGIIT